MATFHIEDSFRIRKRSEMRAQLEAHRLMYPENWAIQRNSMRSLIWEWRAHNLLYDLHLFRSHTKDVDFEWPQRWYTKTIWAILSVFYIP